MRERAFVAVENRLQDMAQAIREGRGLPKDAAATLETGAAVVRLHGKLLRRVKRAIGPNLVFAAEQEELGRRGRYRDKQVFGAVRDFLRGRECAAGCTGGTP